MGFPRTPDAMPAVLLAAGLGTRLAPLTRTLPKCLAPVHGRPLLAYWLEMCRRNGLRPIINTHSNAEMVRAYLRHFHPGAGIELFHEDRLLGTAGTLLALRSRLEDTPFLAVHADNLSFFSMRDFWEAHCRRPRGCVLTMMLFHTQRPQSCGIVELDRDGVVRRFHEKVACPPGNVANGAVYIMEPEIFEILATCEERPLDISLHLVPRCLGRMATFLNEDMHRDIGTVESYAEAQAEMLLRTWQEERGLYSATPEMRTLADNAPWREADHV